MKKLLSLCMLSLSFLVAQADIRLPKVLGNNMVLQRNSSVKLWGWAAPDEQIAITTSWDNKTTKFKATGNADWETSVQTPAAGGPFTITFQGANKILLENILIGEVWICGGQSNMQWSYTTGIKSIKDEFDQLKKLNIRLFHVPKTTSAAPQDNVDANWVACDSNSLKIFSAIGYYFGKNLHNELNVPIGLINSNWGGTPAEVWTPAALVNEQEALKKSAAKQAPTDWWPVEPGIAYNAMIAPLKKYTLAGAIWYQGESNVNAPSTYAQLMETMIGAWRKNWRDDLPFYYVQIAPYHYGLANQGALVREQQEKNLSIKNTGMAVISDLVSDTTNIHPTNKKDVGLRLANLALAKTYGRAKIGYSSPLYRNMETKGNKITLTFDIGNSKGLAMDGKSAKTLLIAGADRKFYPATAKISKNTITVYSDKVAVPQAVHYQFGNALIGNLKNKEGLPVAPFRTDNWDLAVSETK